MPDTRTLPRSLALCADPLVGDPFAGGLGGLKFDRAERTGREHATPMRVIANYHKQHRYLAPGDDPRPTSEVNRRRRGDGLRMRVPFADPVHRSARASPAARRNALMSGCRAAERELRAPVKPHRQGRFMDVQMFFAPLTDENTAALLSAAETVRLGGDALDNAVGDEDDAPAQSSPLTGRAVGKRLRRRPFHFLAAVEKIDNRRPQPFSGLATDPV